MGVFAQELSARLKTKRKVNAHKLVWATAVELAGAKYEELMRDNSLYADWKALCPDLTPSKLQLMFVELMAPKMLEDARHTLAKMLAAPHPKVLKDEIEDALLKDAVFVPGRTAKPGPQRQRVELN